ncbi:MAG: transporter substrate-binding domain-containing protein [Anaerovoracaceae bacterium]
MEHLKKVTALVLILIFTAVMLTGCGGDAAESEEVSQLEAIQSNGKIVIGVEGTYPPFTYHGDDDTLTGFDIELASAIAEKLGVEAEFVESEWDSLLAGVDSGRLDTVINNVTITEERQEKYDFSDPYLYIYREVIVKKENTEIQSLDDFKGKKVANNATGDYNATIEELGAEIVPINTAEEAINLVESGRADLSVFASVSFAEYVKQHPETQVEVAFLVPEEASLTAIPVKKGEEELLNAINSALGELRNDGTLKELSEKYFGDDLTQEE